mgnify:CR=1 FL=1
MHWYLLQTKSNGHKLANEHLSRQNFKVFMPLMIKTSKRGAKFVNSLKPLFPSYLFLGTELNDIPWKSINATRGVSKAVTLDGRYHAIADEIIEGIRCRCDQNGILKPIDEIQEGDRVKIERGPFAEFICTVDQIKDEKRAWVLIDILQQQTRAEVSLDDVSKIN